MIRKIIFSLFGLFLLIIGINNEIIKQRNSKASLPKKANEEKPERVSSSKMEKKIIPNEITQQMRKDEQIIIVQGHDPIRCGRAIYFRRKDMDAQASPNRFVKSAV